MGSLLTAAHDEGVSLMSELRVAWEEVHRAALGHVVVRVAPLPTLQSRGHDVTATVCVCPCSLPPEIIRLHGWEAAMVRNAA